ncbi:CRISPR-associated endonuclease Cas2 [Geochorda subterranea]|uniref:CRISPR-associated endoribonuclease Cas2 n=1 Tax=Geochorda subterranea TaxID=3109564 RepID=A0ABZ1BSZ1_9FIRM|nr:CRISPR-associated endonuclease Cas2 [Limnochorda sp. LNt]WRP15902.1 CRISPR-associated endonuclease Cas2 [Limnochorda sp. LNt]
MTMRHYYLVCYDITDEKRLRRVHRAMLGYGDPLQYSVFRCMLSQKEKALMVAHLSELIHPRQDRLLIINLGPPGEKLSERIEFVGAPLSDPGVPGAVVV